jgi:hypothetical protein
MGGRDWNQFEGVGEKGGDLSTPCQYKGCGFPSHGSPLLRRAGRGNDSELGWGGAECLA